jgi:hypothetical protein
MGLRPTSVWSPSHGRVTRGPRGGLTPSPQGSWSMCWTNLLAGVSWWTGGPLSVPSLSHPVFLLLAKALWCQLAYLSSAGGEREVQLKLSGQCFKWTFLQAELGIDILNFLRAFMLSVDPAVGKLVQDGTGLTLSTTSLSGRPTASAIVSSADPGSLGQVATSAIGSVRHSTHF